MFIVYDEENEKKVNFSELDYGEAFIDPELDAEALIRVRPNPMITEDEPYIAVRLRDGELFPFCENDLVYKVEARVGIKRIL